MRLEFQELAAAKHHNLTPNEWDVLPVWERTRLIAAFRDASDLDAIGKMTEEQQRQLRGQTEWIMLDKVKQDA